MKRFNFEIKIKDYKKAVILLDMLELLKRHKIIISSKILIKEAQNGKPTNWMGLWGRQNC